MSKIKNRSGPLSDPEKKIISNNPAVSDEQLAAQLRRNPKTIHKYRLKMGEVEYTESLKEPLACLHEIYFWLTVKNQLLDDEVSYFEQQWVRYWDQFSHSDILATDEVMMKDAILLDIMSNRTLTLKAKQLRRSSELTAEINLVYEQEPEDRNTVHLSNMETQYGACQASIIDSTKEYLEYQKKKDDKMTQLKATRDQRLKQAEQSGKNFWELCRALNEKQARQRDSVLMERMRIAAERVKEDWSGQTIKFADNEHDRVLLIPEGEINDEE